MLASLCESGHHVYVTLYAGISYFKMDSTRYDALNDFEKSVSRCVSGGVEQSVLVDKGTGFWSEHKLIWSTEQWFCVENEKSLAQIIDRYILRQKVMLSLRVRKVLSPAFMELHTLSTAAFAFREKGWPSGVSGMDEDANNLCDLEPDDPQTHGTHDADFLPQGEGLLSPEKLRRLRHVWKSAFKDSQVIGSSTTEAIPVPMRSWAKD
jgi:hypothetical protein